MTAEHQRLRQNALRPVPLAKWGPYLSERQWGTVREDYGPWGDAWHYFPFEHSHARVYKWGEDGIAGISDYMQNLCFAMAFLAGFQVLSYIFKKEGRPVEQADHLLIYAMIM